MKNICLIMSILLFSAPIYAKTYFIPEYNSTPVIDGDLSVSETSESLVIEMSYPSITTSPSEGTLQNDAPANDSDLSATWYLSWDEQDLYLACRVYDDSLKFTKDYPGRYNEQDCVQLALNFINDPNLDWLKALFDIAPQTADSYGPDFYSDSSYLDSSRLLYDAKVLSDGYTVEVLLPWMNFDSKYVAKAGDSHGICLMLADYDGDGSTTNLVDFGSNTWLLHDVSAWNSIVLVDSDGCGNEEMSTADINRDCSVDLSDLAIIAENWMVSTLFGDENFELEKELVVDNHFQQGMNLLSQEDGQRTVVDTLKWSKAGQPVWNVAQWNSIYSLEGAASQNLVSGAYLYANQAKGIISGPVNTSDADIVLSLDSRPEFNNQQREDGQPWPCILLNQTFLDCPNLDKIKYLDFNVDVKLLESERFELAGYNPGLHSAQFQVFFTVQNLNRASSGYGDYLWFGIQIYDDRYSIPQEHIKEDGFTQKLIYAPAGDVFTDDLVAVGNWAKISKNILPLVVDALNEAWNRGYLTDSQDVSDYTIGSMNIGWEVPGLNNVSMQFKNLSLKVCSK